MKKFIDFKNFLNKYNIMLFDGDCRIAHYHYLQLNNSFNQTGGSLANKIKNNGQNLLRIFVYSLVTNNVNRINYILEKII